MANGDFKNLERGLNQFKAYIAKHRNDAGTTPTFKQSVALADELFTLLDGYLTKDYKTKDEKDNDVWNIGKWRIASFAKSMNTFYDKTKKIVSDLEKSTPKDQASCELYLVLSDFLLNQPLPNIRPNSFLGVDTQKKADHLWTRLRTQYIENLRKYMIVKDEKITQPAPAPRVQAQEQKVEEKNEAKEPMNSIETHAQTLADALIKIQQYQQKLAGMLDDKILSLTEYQGHLQALANTYKIYGNDCKKLAADMQNHLTKLKEEKNKLGVELDTLHLLTQAKTNIQKTPMLRYDEKLADIIWPADQKESAQKRDEWKKVSNANIKATEGYWPGNFIAAGWRHLGHVGIGSQLSNEKIVNQNILAAINNKLPADIAAKKTIIEQQLAAINPKLAAVTDLHATYTTQAKEAQKLSADINKTANEIHECNVNAFKARVKTLLNKLDQYVKKSISEWGWENIKYKLDINARHSKTLTAQHLQGTLKNNFKDEPILTPEALEKLKKDFEKTLQNTTQEITTLDRASKLVDILKEATHEDFPFHPGGRGPSGG
jgi:hypothetical protein